MREFIAETGGRYTYADDIINLQELALSMNSIFSNCDNFIISGCELTGQNISSGFVWLSGKIRYFEGASNVTHPYYLVEHDNSDMVVYANDINKKGRNNYLCHGASSIPTETIAGILPQFIEISSTYAPRFIDKFIGRYAVLLDTPFTKQTIKKDLIVCGNFSVDKSLASKTSISVANARSGYTLKSIVKENNNCSIGSYLNGLLNSEICVQTDGSIAFYKKSKELAKISESGTFIPKLFLSALKVSSLWITGNTINNIDTNSDEGAININTRGFENEKTKYRDFRVYDGKQESIPLFQIQGKNKTATINGSLIIKSSGESINLTSSTPMNTIAFKDNNGGIITKIGFTSDENRDFSFINTIGNIILSPKYKVDIGGDLCIKGINIVDHYVSQTSFTLALAKKVDSIEGKQLSTEDFTLELKRKLENIKTGTLDGLNGFVTSAQVIEALGQKLSANSNLSDVKDKNSARTSLDVYSKEDSDNKFLQTNLKLLELVSLSAEEINGLSVEQAAALKAEKQQTIRSNIDAEKKGTGNLKLEKSANLSDLIDVVVARKNISVYSVEETDTLLSKKLGIDSAYTGAIFTSELKTKLEKIKDGAFNYIDEDGVSHADIEGYLLTSLVKKELAKKAERLLSGNSKEEQEQIASNIGVYNKQEATEKFVSIASLFQDYINYLVKEGKTTSQAQQILLEKLNVFSKEEIKDVYVRKDTKLADLVLPDANSKKIACQQLGAAYAEEYQTKILDTGWLQMENSGSATDTRTLFVRQIGNIVSIQGTINTSKRDGSAWGGIVAILPNKISAPKYGIRSSMCDYNDDAKYNRGASFVIPGNGRKLIIYASGWDNRNTELNFTYMI